MAFYDQKWAMNINDSTGMFKSSKKLLEDWKGKSKEDFERGVGEATPCRGLLDLNIVFAAHITNFRGYCSFGSCMNAIREYVSIESNEYQM